MKLILLILSLGTSLFALTQQPDNDFPGTGIVLSRYTPAELEEMGPAKREAIWYYYTHSYILEQLKCDECLPFDARHFDISKYEHLRQKDKRRIKDDPKQGFRLTLLSTNELEHKLTVHAPQIPAEDEN